MKEILKQVIQGKAHINVGKAGITPALLEQILKQFKKNKILKVKFLSLNDYEGMKEATLDLSSRINVQIMDVRGKTCVIQDLRKPKKKEY